MDYLRRSRAGSAGRPPAEEEEEEKEEERREKEEAPSQQAAERGSKCVGQIPSSRLPPAGCGRGEDPTDMPSCSPVFGGLWSRAQAVPQPGVLQ